MSTSITVAIALAALLGGAALGMTDPTVALRIAGVALAAGTAAAAVAAVKGYRRANVAVIVLGIALLALFAFHVSEMPTPVPMRPLQAAAVLAWGAVLLAGVIRLTRITDWNRALLLSFSVAIPLLIADMLVPPPMRPQSTRWQVTTRPDPDTGFRYIPNSTAKNFYPDNPRGYFDQTRPDLDAWSIETHGGSEARFEFAQAGEGELIRVQIPKLVGSEAWHVKLQAAPLDVKAGNNYMVSFNARAAANRQVSCAVGQNHEPWELIGKYHEFSVGTEWTRFECPFQARSSDSNARLFFDLAKSDVPVELQAITIIDEATGQRVTARTGDPEFVINYRFNALGMRGPDRAIPAPPGTFRLITLGDSYALGVGVKEADTVAAQLEKRLNDAAASKADKTTYEVLNGGVSGYDTRQARMAFEKYYSQYKPHVVVLMMVFNDDLAYNEELKAGLVSPQSKAGELLNLWGRVEALKLQDRRYDYSGSIYQVRQLNEACKRLGTKLAVAFFRTASNAPWLKLVEDVTAGLKGTGIPVVDLGTVLVPKVESQSSLLELTVHAVDGHPNEISHGLAAGELERFLRSEKLVP